MNIAFRFILMHCVGWMGIAGARRLPMTEGCGKINTRGFEILNGEW